MSRLKFEFLRVGARVVARRLIRLDVFDKTAVAG